MDVRITFDHPDSHFGIPVFVNRDGKAMQYHHGVQAVLDRRKINRGALARACGVSESLVGHWLTGHRYPGAAHLNVMARLLKPLRRRRAAR